MFAVYVVFTFGCKQQSNVDELQNKTDDIQLVSLELKGTVWKLAGIVDSKTGVIKELDPKNCEDCYTLWFDTDHNVTVIDIQQRYKLDLSNLEPFAEEIDKILKCPRYDKDGKDYCDIEGFERSIITTGSYLITDVELKLFQHYLDNDEKELISSSYLLFKRVDRDPPATLRGTKWKLAGMVDIQTEELTELLPKNCENCYTLSFWGDSVLIAHSISVGEVLDLIKLDIELDPARPGIWGNPEQLYAEIWLTRDGGDDVTSYEDSFLYRCGIAYTEFYKLSSEELKLYFVFQEKNYYLLFKLIYQ